MDYAVYLREAGNKTRYTADSVDTGFGSMSGTGEDGQGDCGSDDGTLTSGSNSPLADGSNHGNGDPFTCDEMTSRWLQKLKRDHTPEPLNLHQAANGPEITEPEDKNGDTKNGLDSDDAVHSVYRKQDKEFLDIDRAQLCNDDAVHSVYRKQDKEFLDIDRAQLCKTSSLKASTSPPDSPDTPGTRKYVRFADALGLDLTSVKLLINQEAPPDIPASALADLHLADESEAAKPKLGGMYLSPWFAQPHTAPNFLQHVEEQKIALESVAVSDLMLTGVIRVANLAFDKRVWVKFTVDEWRTYRELECLYVEGSSNGIMDKFSFTIVAPSDFRNGSRMEMCFRFSCHGHTFWDSNQGNNYVCECYTRVLSSGDLTSAGFGM